jgi:hypothetical protein
MNISRSRSALSSCLWWPTVAKFKIEVKIKAEFSYEVEVDHDSEANAEDEALAQWRERLPEDFQVEKGYITDWETEIEQLTAICPQCGTEHTIPTADRNLAGSDCWHEDQDYCKPCGAKIELEDKANVH